MGVRECGWMYVYVGRMCVCVVTGVADVCGDHVWCECGNMGGRLSTGDDILLEKKSKPPLHYWFQLPHSKTTKRPFCSHKLPFFP